MRLGLRGRGGDFFDSRQEVPEDASTAIDAGSQPGGELGQLGERGRGARVPIGFLDEVEVALGELGDGPEHRDHVGVDHGV
jgi:hypothetical protein